MTISIQGIEIKHVENLDDGDPRFDAVSFDIFGTHHDAPNETFLLGQLKTKSLNNTSAQNFSCAVLDDFLNHEQSKIRSVCEALRISELCEYGADIVLVESLVVDTNFQRKGVGSSLLERALRYFTQTMSSPYFAISAEPTSDNRHNQYPPQFAPFTAIAIGVDDPAYDIQIKNNRLFLNAMGFSHYADNIYTMNSKHQQR